MSAVTHCLKLVICLAHQNFFIPGYFVCWLRQHSPESIVTKVHGTAIVFEIMFAIVMQGIVQGACTLRAEAL